MKLHLTIENITTLAIAIRLAHGITLQDATALAEWNLRQSNSLAECIARIVPAATPSR